MAGRSGGLVGIVWLVVGPSPPTSAGMFESVQEEEEDAIVRATSRTESSMRYHSLIGVCERWRRAMELTIVVCECASVLRRTGTYVVCCRRGSKMSVYDKHFGSLEGVVRGI